MALRLLLISIGLLVNGFAFAQSEQFAMKQLSEEQKLQKSPFCVKNTPETKAKLAEQGISIKFETERWLFITSTANEILSMLENNIIEEYFLEANPPALMNDSARARHFVDQVHDGLGLSGEFKGDGIIIGYVDTGIDFNHPDFKNADGSTRIISYWDQTTGVGSTLSEYGYGIVWDSTQLNAGACTSMDATGHGSTVAGAGSGNGISTGYNHGVAPESDIVIVESDFSAFNWTLTVADACDYIFKIADSLGKPAVVNLSLGTYFGSHDGSDPASEFIEALLDEQKGRIVVCAAGNSGNFAKYHCAAQMDSDTSFVWFNNNSNGLYGPNTVFFDLWSDSIEGNFDYNLKVLRAQSNYQTRGETVYRNTLVSLGVPIFDTIWNANGNRLATLEIYTDFEDGNYHMQCFVSKLDTTAYKIGFYTTGAGSYDLWSGQNFGFNSIITTLPTQLVFPSITNYILPDSLQSIVSSWNCSEKVISVGNIKNRTSYPTLAGTTYVPSDNVPVGKLSINSSKGPSRVGVLKPDIVASGDVMLSPGPLAYLAVPANFNKIDPGGFHMGNGGTSMSSPVVAGIAALFLERCTEANYQDFKNELIASAMPNNYTGTLPNYAYGNGLANAHTLMLSNEFNISFDPLGICFVPEEVGIVSSQPLISFEWWNGDTDSTQLISSPSFVQASGFNEHGCESESAMVQIVQFDLPTISSIALVNNQLTVQASNDYQWTYNGIEILGATNATLNPGTLYGEYSCYTTTPDGCVIESPPFNYYLGMGELSDTEVIVYPNPTDGKVYFSIETPIQSFHLFDTYGKEIHVSQLTENSIDLGALASGIYTIFLESQDLMFKTKLIRR